MDGVIHVGAHRGEEVSGYLAEGRSPIICFEPQDLNWSPPGGVTLVPLALADYNGKMTLRVPHRIQSSELDTQMASGLILIPDRAVTIGWTPTECDCVEVDAGRFDDWAEDDPDFVTGSFSLLVMDVNGMEGQVLSGFGDYLDGFSELVIECSETPLWEYGASAKEVVAMLEAHGFVQDSPLVPCGDVRFVKIGA